MFNIEEPYYNTGLSFINYNGPDNHRTIYHIRWIDDHGKDRAIEINEKEANKWQGYAILCEFCNEEILILR